MTNKLGLDNNSVDIESEIKNKRCGLHYIKLEEHKKLQDRLNMLRNDNLFNKYNMSYSYTLHDEYIALVLYSVD